MSGPPRILDELGAELDRAVRADVAAGTKRRWRWHPGPLAVVMALLGAGGVAAAGTQLLGEGEPIPAPKAADVAPGAYPAEGSARLVGEPAADPVRGQPWRLRLSRTAAGDVCTAVGQTVDDRFGVVGLDRIFRVTPLGVGDSCSRSPRSGTVVAGARVFAGRDAAQARTVVAGLAGSGVRRLRLTVRGSAPQVLVAAADGAFLAVSAGYPEDLRPVLEVVRSDGGSRRIAFADTGKLEVADPEGGEPWAIENGRYREPGSPAGLFCAQATRRSSLALALSGPLTPVHCGFLGRGPGFSSARRYVPSATPRDGTPWGLNAARTVIYGGVSADVKSVEVRGPGGLVRRPRVFRPSGAFLVVLDGHIDPRPLKTVLILRDGSKRTLDDDAALTPMGRPVRPTAPPRWRSLASQEVKRSRGFAVPVAGSFASSRPVQDPAGGPAWAIRTFKATLAKGVRVGGGNRPKGFTCFITGPVVDGAPRQPTSSGPGRVLDPASEADTFCNEDERPKRIAVGIIGYAGDPGSYAPGLSRVSVAGQVPLATKVELLGLGAPRSLPITGDGGFLALLPGTTRAKLSLRATFADGRTLEEAPRDGDLRVGTSRVDARAPDPDGTAPWAIALGPGLGKPDGCERYGRLVLGRLAFISPQDGSVRFGDAGSSCGARRLTRKRPFTFGVQPEPAAPGAATTTAQIQRRTLPGRTRIAGVVRADVAELELQTPRDVRLLRPTGPGHAYIAVYDGLFTSGKITVRVRFKDGTVETVTQQTGF